MTNSSLIRHMKSYFVMTKDFRCQKCGKYFKTAETLGKHMAGIHKSTKSKFQGLDDSESA